MACAAHPQRDREWPPAEPVLKDVEVQHGADRRAVRRVGGTQEAAISVRPARAWGIAHPEGREHERGKLRRIAGAKRSGMGVVPEITEAQAVALIKAHHIV